MDKTFRRHAFSVFLIAATAFFAGEAIYTALAEPRARLWMVPFHVGVGVPIILAGAWLGARAADFWRSELPGQIEPPAVTARLLSAGIMAALWVATTSVFVAKVAHPMATDSLAGLSTAIAALVLLFLCVAGFGVVVPFVETLVDRLCRIGLLRPLGRPITWLGLAAFTAALAIAAGFAVAPDTFLVLPWAYVVGPTTAIAAGTGAHFFLRSQSDHVPQINRYGTIAMAALGLFVFFLPMSFEEARQSFVDRSNVASQFKSALHPILDFDGDGYLFFYAGGDCAPFDPDRGPHATEIPNDGIDWNCSGSDLTVEPDAFHGGPAQVERPDGIVDNPHVILITTDALSHPHTTVGGYERDVTPNLADWAERATVFETAFATSTSTRLAFPGLLSSRMNSQMHLERRPRHPYPYADHEETLATVLRDAGYRTVHIPGVDIFHRWAGYWNGYDEIDVETYAEAEDELHTSPELTDAAVELIETHDDDQPLHLWIHYFDHHGPYVIPDGAKTFGRGRSAQDRYDSELHFADSHWGRLFDAIEEHWEPDEYIVIFTSDHGEAFDENHPRSRHGSSVYTRPLHVPLIIQAPWGRGQRIDGLTGHIDVLPTVANLVDAEPSDGWEERLGESLIPSLTEGTPPQKTVMHSLYYIPEAVLRDENPFEMIGLRTDEWYFYDDRRRGDRRLVRWREDPLDRECFGDEKPDKFEAYRYLANRKLEWLREREIALTHLVDDD